MWELRVGAIDSLGLIGYAQVSVIVDNFAPSASVTAPAKVDHVTGGHVFTTNGEVELFIPPPALCTDNAAMAAVAVEKWRVADFAPLDLDAHPTYRGKP